MHSCFDDEKTKQLDRHFCTRNRLDAMVMLIDGSKFAEVYYFKAGVEMFLDCLPVSTERQDIFYHQTTIQPKQNVFGTYWVFFSVF